MHGYHGVSLRSVNDELGVSRTLLDQRFGSKADLWRAAVDWAFRPFDELRDHGRIKSIPYVVFSFLLTSGGSAPYGQLPLASMVSADLGSNDLAQVRLYAENVAEILINGLSLPG